MTDEDRKLIHQLAKDETIGERIIASIAPSGIIKLVEAQPIINCIRTSLNIFNISLIKRLLQKFCF